MDLKILEFNGEADHIHTLIEFPHALSISTIVNALKAVSSRRYGQARYPKSLEKQAYVRPSPVCINFRLCGAPLDVLKQYIQHQEKPS